MKAQSHTSLLAWFCGAALLAIPAHATVTNVAWYRLGEKDSGATSGQTVRSTTVDLSGAHNLLRAGSPHYTNNVASAAAHIGSSLAVLFSGTSFYTNNASATTARNNFGIEAWVANLTGVDGTYFIAHNGNAAANGWGLALLVSHHPFLGLEVEYVGEFGGGAVAGSGVIRNPLPGVWVHVALVRNNGTNRFYLNGRAVGSASTTTPATPSAGFSIGVGPGGVFPCMVDEVRVFTFAPAEFSTDDLLVNQPLVTTLAATDLAPANATLNGVAGSFGFPTIGWFEWGTNESLGNVTPPRALGVGFTSTNFSEVLTGLSLNAAYFFRAAASNSFGVLTGAVTSFTLHPTVATLPVSELGATNATLNGVANPKGGGLSGWFEWGLTTNYGNLTPPQALGSGGNATNYSAVLTNLFPGGAFHFRAVASNGTEVITGTNQSFVTPAAAFADVVIPGAVNVTIQPVQAVTEGARWALDGGPLQLSGLPESPIVPGHHTVRFGNLPNWGEPPQVEIFVVGGKTSEVVVVFTPLQTFDFHDVPEQHARAGESVEFFLTGASNAVLQVSATPPPAGVLSFDPATGRFSYTPAAGDRLPFTLTFLIGGVPVATTTITPLPDLPNEEVTINYDRPLPDDSSRDYVTISESLSATEELFNNVSNRVLTVDISGKTLVFATNHPANLHRQYNGRENVKEFRLFADRVIIRSPLVLPQTHVTIHARELRFEDDGVLDTTPKSLWTKPRAVEWADDNFIGFPGSPGHNGGDADVFVESFHADPAPPIRFVLRGGDGGPPGEGRNGVFEGGLTPSFFPGVADPNDPNNGSITNWIRLMARAGNPTNCGVDNNRLVFYSEFRNNGVLNPSLTCGSTQTVARGESAVPSGIPGAGGRGGTLRSTLDLGAYVSQAGGTAGTPGSNYVGGTLVYQYVYRFMNNITVGPNPGLQVSYTQAPKVPGANAAAPAGTNGVPGSVVFVPDPSAWLHSFGVRSVVQFASDAYLDGHDGEVRALLSDYRDYIAALQPVVGPVTNLTDAEFAETTGLDQEILEMGTILHRIDSNLDFFGNPAGWAPMLSFEANLIAFQHEIDQSIPILYLAYWLNYAATNLQDSLAASGAAVDKLRVEFNDMVVAYNEAQVAIPQLKLQSQTILDRIVGLRARLAQLERDLLARAQQNVEDKHKVPLWKKALGVLSVVADLVPVGQPTVGKVGAGLSLLARIDPEHPVSSAASLTNAFDVFKNNVNVSVCFSGSNTNSSGTNNAAAKKEKDKRLTECGKFLQSELKELAGVFKDVQVDKKEVAAELEKLKAADPVFKEVTAELEQLNKDKEHFAEQLAAALQTLTRLTSGMAENTLATDNLEDRVARQLTILDHNALLHIKEMERRAKDRLLTFQYFVAKAFQYRVLQPYSGNLHLNRLFDRFQQIVAGPNGHLLTPEEFNNLKSLYLADLRDTVAQTLTVLNANAPQHSLPIQLQIVGEDLQKLNTEGQLTINLRRRGIFPSTHENLRIIDLRTRNLTAHPVGGGVGSFALLFLDFEHLGISRLNSGGQTFLFRHYQTEAVNPITWNTVFDGVANNFSNSQLSPAAQSLLSVLLDQPTSDNLLLFSYPAADADILIHKEVQTDNNIDLAIDSLVIEVQYEFAAANSARPQLEVVITDQLEPVIAVSQTDLNQRRDGQGDFRRVYPSGTVVTLQAPASYGARPFERWLINNQPRSNGVTSVTLALNSSTTAEARFGPAPASGVAPEITQQPRNTSAEIGGVAGFTVAATGTAPLGFRWQKAGVPLHDGGRIAGAATAALVISNIAFADAAAYSVVVSNFVSTRTSQPVTLTVTGPSLALLPAGPDSVGFQFPTIVGLTYIIERKLRLEDPAWETVQVSPGTGGMMQFTRPRNAISSFFRLRVD